MIKVCAAWLLMKLCGLFSPSLCPVCLRLAAECPTQNITAHIWPCHRGECLSTNGRCDLKSEYLNTAQVLQARGPQGYRAELPCLRCKAVCSRLSPGSWGFAGSVWGSCPGDASPQSLPLCSHMVSPCVRDFLHIFPFYEDIWMRGPPCSQPDCILAITTFAMILFPNRVTI